MKYFVILLLSLSLVSSMIFEFVYGESHDFRFVELNDSYFLGDKITIKFEKITQQPCPSYEISMMKAGLPESMINIGVEPLCAIPGPVEPYLFSGDMERREFFDSAGTYIIKVKLDNETIQKEIKITDNRLMGNKFDSSFSINQKQVRYIIPYQISGGTVENMQLACDPLTLTVSVSSNDSGILEMEIPNGMIRSIFSVHVDDQEWDDVSIDSDTLTIIFPKLSNIVEINGTYLLTHDKNRDGACDIVHDPPHSFIVSPLKQFDSGIPIEQIQCKEDLTLLQKYDYTPVCVAEQTKQKLIERGWTAKDDSILKTSTNCMTLEQSKETAPFFKTPAYLPEGYFHVCSQSGIPSESYIVYHHQEIMNWNIPELVSDGAIFIYQIDERNIVREEKYETFGTAEQRIQADYDGVTESNPSLQPQLIKINGMLAYAVDSCDYCGIQTANFTDETFIQKSTSTETKIKFIDENGINYMLKTTLPLDELILVAESLQ